MSLLKKVQLLGAVSTLALTLTGCGATNTDSNTNVVESDSENTQQDTTIIDQTAAYPVTLEVTDSEGNTYDQTFTQSPQRVITNNQSSLELLLKLGLKDVIVGTMPLDTELPEELQEDFEGINVLTTSKTDPAKEVVIGSSPDLVIGRAASFTDESFGTIDTLNDVGANVYVQEASLMNTDQTLDNIILDVRNIGTILYIEEAETLATELEERLAAVKEQASSMEGDPVKVLVMVAYNDGSYGTYGANASLQEEMLNILNAENVVEMGGSQSLENLIDLNPDLIVYVTADKNAAMDETAVQSLKENELISEVSAIANDHIVEVSYTEFMGYGYRTFDCLETLADVVMEIAAQ